MPHCFVIQPFDKSTFDMRYKDIFEPAIREAGLDPYRVDLDPAATIPIEKNRRKDQKCRYLLCGDGDNDL